MIGSPAWMSPEQVDGGPVTSTADMFSLGSVLVFAATGRPPFGKGPDGSRSCGESSTKEPYLGDEGFARPGASAAGDPDVGKGTRATRPLRSRAYFTSYRGWAENEMGTITQVLNRRWILPASEVIHVENFPPFLVPGRRMSLPPAAAAGNSAPGRTSIWLVCGPRRQRWSSQVGRYGLDR